MASADYTSHGGCAATPSAIATGSSRPREPHSPTDGIDVSVEAIARRAGVGMGTLYRRFPTKAELIDAILEDVLTEVCQRCGVGSRRRRRLVGLQRPSSSACSSSTCGTAVSRT